MYWVVDMGEKMGFVGGAVTWCLVWGTGLWDRGVRWPRRWVGVTNRGLRGFNMKVVVIKGSMWKELLGYLSLFGPFGYWVGTKGMRYEYVPRDIERTPGGEKEKARKFEDPKRGDHWIEEDVAPGGDTIKLLLLPKPFSPDFREDWDTYRIAYWDKENERRAALRKVIKLRDRERAKREGGWLWWTGWRGWRNLLGKPILLGPPTMSDSRISSNTAGSGAQRHIREKPSLSQIKREKRRGTGGDGLLGDNHSRSSSRSSTPTPEPEGRPRRGTASESSRRTSSTQRVTATRKKTPTSLAGTGRPSSRISNNDSRPATPENTPPIPSASASTVASGVLTSPSRTVSKRASNLSISSSSDVEKKEETPPTDVEIKEEKD